MKRCVGWSSGTMKLASAASVRSPTVTGPEARNTSIPFSASSPASRSAIPGSCAECSTTSAGPRSPSAIPSRRKAR